MKECFAITTYCNTSEKVEALLRTIENIKQYGFPIFLHTHYPLPFEIQQKVHSYFYSSDNPILNRYSLFWHTIPNYKLETKVYDITYTVLKAWRESINILNEYDKIHMINYDTNLTPEVFNLTRKYPQSVFLQIPPDYTGINYTLMIYYCLNKKSFEYFRENLRLEKYLAFNPEGREFLPIPEEYISTVIANEDFYQVPWTEFDGQKLIEYDVVSENRNTWDSITEIENAKIFIGEHNGIGKMIFFDVKKEINIRASIFYNGYEEKYLGALNFERNISTTELFTLERPFKDIKDVKIHIDGKPIDDNFIKKFFKLQCKIYDV